MKKWQMSFARESAYGHPTTFVFLISTLDVLLKQLSKYMRVYDLLNTIVYIVEPACPKKPQESCLYLSEENAHLACQADLQRAQLTVLVLLTLQSEGILNP